MLNDKKNTDNKHNHCGNLTIDIEFLLAGALDSKYDKTDDQISEDIEVMQYNVDLYKWASNILTDCSIILSNDTTIVKT